MGRGGNDTTATGPTVAPRLNDYEREFFTPKTQQSVLHVRSLDEDILLIIARDEKHESPEFKVTREALGGKTNPFWLTSQCAQEAYMRDLIDEQELDWLTR